MYKVLSAHSIEFYCSQALSQSFNLLRKEEGLVRKLHYNVSFGNDQH
jgi:hypothetical protein